MEWATYLDEYEKLVIRMNSPRVMVDNVDYPTATHVMIDSARKHGILLEAVQVLTDLNLPIKKAYISSDGRWFMDVFHVTYLNVNKLTESVIKYIEHTPETIQHVSLKCFDGLTTLELTRTDQIGLLSEVFALLWYNPHNLLTAQLENCVTAKQPINGRDPNSVSQSLTHIPLEFERRKNLLGGVVPFNSSFLRRMGKNLDLSGNPGLCLSPSEEANGVYSQVGICGRNKTGYMFNKSEASSELSISFFSITAFCIVGMLHYFSINMCYSEPNNGGCRLSHSSPPISPITACLHEEDEGDEEDEGNFT